MRRKIEGESNSPVAKVPIKGSTVVWSPSGTHLDALGEVLEALLGFRGAQAKHLPTKRRIFSRRTNHTQEARVYLHDGPIVRRKRGYILMTGQSYAGSAGKFSRCSNNWGENRNISSGRGRLDKGLMAMSSEPSTNNREEN
eukprot:1183383-Prorocentrum_minimum.AAC.1